MAAVPRHLIFADFFRRDKRQAIIFPFVEAATHRIDVGVAEVLQRFCCEGRTDASRAVDDDRLSLVRQCLVRLNFKEPARQENGIIEMALFPLIAFTDIEESETTVRVELIANLLNRNFSNLLL